MRSRVSAAFLALALLAIPSLLRAQRAQVTIAPRDPVITAPTLCQSFTATVLTFRGAQVSNPALAWTITNPTEFTVDTVGQVCSRTTPVATAGSRTGVIVRAVGRGVRDTTSLTVMPQPPSRATATIARPSGAVAMRVPPGLPTLQPAQQQPADTTAQIATIARLPPTGIAQRYQSNGAAPSGVSVSSGSPVSATIYWTAAAGAVNYSVARGTSASGPFQLVNQSVNGTSFTDAGLAPVTTYFWTVSANYGLGGPGPGTSAPVTATTLAPKNPTDFTAKAGKVGEIVLNWSPRSDAAYYMLSGDGIADTQVNGSTYTLTGLDGGPRNLSLVAYYSSGGQAYADPTNPARVRAAALPKNGIPWLSKHGAGSTTEAINYFNTIGATPGKATLTQWKTANGFPASGPAPDEVRVQYFNAQDLNLGRDTHCRVTTPASGSSPAHIACFQNNSGPPPGTADFPNAESALNDMVQGKPPFATVAMDQEASGNVNFYAYNDAGSLVNAVVLDNEGPKAMPNVCTACHGGYYNSGSHTMSGASFLPFDVFGFKYASAPGFSLADQQEGFRKENAMVRSTAPNSANPDNPIVAYIDGTYSNAVTSPGTTASDSWVPAGWSAKPNVYDVFKRTCRTCHLASQGFDFMTYQQLANALTAVSGDVCGARVMPHAEVPYRKFWTQTTVYLPGYFSDPSVLGLTGCP